MAEKAPGVWPPENSFDHPCWAAYRPLLQRLPFDRFPGPSDLNDLLPDRLTSRGGAAIRFVPDDGSPGLPYERRIHETGEVPTRPANCHDLFNGLAWCLLPETKRAMNALHYRELDPDPAAPRGPVRDAVTLLDESGVVVFGRDPELLEAIAAGQWEQAFVACRDSWLSRTRVVLCGHALLEKFLHPYKSITAHAMLFLLKDDSKGMPGLEPLDRMIAAQLEGGGLDAGPSALTPLPLAGIPGWWPGGSQDADFYADVSVFRPRGKERAAASVVSVF